MEKLTDITVKCSICLYKDNPAACQFTKCVKCVADKKPNPGCVGVDNCRSHRIPELNNCKNFRALAWDN